MTGAPPGLPRPPVALGCTAMAAALGLVGLVIALGVVFLESGSDDGKATLDPVRSYALGSVTYVSARNLFVVRLATGDVYALADLDAANRASASRRCRVGPVAATDPALPELLEKLGSRLSPEAAGSTLVFREDCFGAVYDVTGLRLDADDANLDRYPVEIDGKGNVVVNTARRQCSRRDATAPFATIACK